MAKSNFIKKFLEQVEKQPLAVAIEFDNSSITYKELHSASLEVYSYLSEYSREEKHIGIESTSDFKSYANIIGVWMFGAAYVPLKSNYPEEVRDQILESLEIKTVLNSKELKTALGVAKKNLNIEDSIGECAYIIHTSGSTGVPKAVFISHENLNAFTSHYLNTSKYEFNETDRFLQSYELSFDVSIFCYSIPLMIGATLVLPKDKGVKYMTILSSIIKDKITVCSNVPSVAKYALPRLSEISMASLRYCFFSGESLFGSWAKAWMNSATNAQVYNCYGPTETTIVCTSEHLNVLDASYFESKEPLPLGVPFETMNLTVKDNEICFSGAQVFLGYTGGVFTIVTPQGDKHFYTGDNGILDEGGKLIFKGRSDDQIQINGFRVELSGIDTLILKEFNLFTKSMVFSDEKKPDKILTVIEGGDWIKDDILRYLGSKLPDYSLPNDVLSTMEFPMNGNEKLDLPVLRKWCLEKLATIN